MAPGLRVGYLAIPEGALDSFAQVVRSTTWMAAPLTAEIAADWVADGTGLDLAEAHRIEAIARQRMARRILQDWDTSGDDASYHLWLKLPEPWTADGFALQARLKGVGVSPASIFALTRNAPAGVRLCLCAPADRPVLENALMRIVDILRTHPGGSYGIV